MELISLIDAESYIRFCHLKTSTSSFRMLPRISAAMSAMAAHSQECFLLRMQGWHSWERGGPNEAGRAEACDRLRVDVAKLRAEPSCTCLLSPSHPSLTIVTSKTAFQRRFQGVLIKCNVTDLSALFVVEGGRSSQAAFPSSFLYCSFGRNKGRTL